MGESPRDFPIELRRIPLGVERAQLSTKQRSGGAPQAEADRQPFSGRFLPQDLSHDVIDHFNPVCRLRS
jgi:hypothetical protein